MQEYTFLFGIVLNKIYLCVNICCKMTTELTELQFHDWLDKVNERLTFARLKINDGKDISEDDYDMYKMLFRDWYNGEHPIFVNKMVGEVQSVSQQGLFSDNTTVYPETITIGTDIDTSDVNQNTTEQ